jgi:hypothetical protein
MNTKPIRIGILLLVLLSAGVVLTLRTWYRQDYDCQTGKTPIKDYLVTMDATPPQTLIEQSRGFATEYGFGFDVVYYTPNHQEFLVDLTSKNIEITITNSFAQGEFEVSIYNNNCIHPTQIGDISGLVQGLQSIINKIPNATITERP